MKQGELFGSEPGATRSRKGAETALLTATAPSKAEGDDPRARRLATSSFERPLLVEAGAGTGKTATLVARALCWATTRGWEEAAAGASGAAAEPERIAARVLRGIVAITFTEAASAEMSSRLGQALAEIERLAGERAPDAITDSDLPKGLGCALLPADRSTWLERTRALRATLDQLTISTIHAYCRRLLAAHPIEAGLSPAFAIDPAYTEIDLVLREVLEEHLEEAWRTKEEADLLALALRGFGPPAIEETLRALVRAGARAAEFAVDPLREEVCERLEDVLGDALERLLAASAPLAELHKSPTSVETVEALAGTRSRLARDGAGARERFARWRSELVVLWPEKRRKRLEEWRKKKLNKSEGAAIGSLADELAAATSAFELALEPFLEADPEVLECGRRVVRTVLEALERELSTRGLASFSDLLRDARTLLVRHPSVAEAERRNLRQLFVDEFQDTDADQCEIVRRLGLEGAQRPGLFVVGDPKQSIYAWRNADLAAYDAFKTALRERGGEVLHLTRNFRSVAPVLEEVERVLAPVMIERPGFQPALTRLEATVASSGRAGPGVEYWISWPRGADGALGSDVAQFASSYQAEARAVADDLARLAQAGVPWKDAALLFRSLTGVEVYLDELKERSIPFEVQSDRKYYQRREVVDATALVRAVLDPNDQLALVAFLRSPAVGVPDAALFPLWSARFPELVARLTRPDPERFAELETVVAQAAARVPRSIPGHDAIAGWSTSLTTALAALATARASFQRDPADAWVARLRALFLSEASEAARFLGSYRLANLGRFFRELVIALEERAGDVHAVLRTLRTNLSREREVEMTLPTESGRDAVQVLTVHGAKGLEFPHVYLCQTHRPPKLEETDETQFERRGGLVSYAFFGTRTPSHTATSELRRAAENAERVRLLYVALTRAAERVVVLGAWKPGATPPGVERSKTLADLIAHRPGFAEALAEVAGRAKTLDGTPFVDAHGAHWKLAALSEHAVSPRSEEEEARLPSSAEVRRQSTHLAERRAWAAERQARPLGAAASADEPFERHEARERSEPAITRDAAQAAGTAVHAALEGLELLEDPAQALARARDRLPALVAAAAPAPEAAAALERARELWERFAAGPLCAQLFALGEHVLARELAVLLPPARSNDGAEADGAVAFVSGAIDLLYRDPSSGEPVVVDFKTDRVAGPEIAERATTYRLQGELYARAVREALALPRAPRFELWFLHAGEILSL